MRFSLRTMLLATAFIAITLGGYCIGWRLTYELNGLPQLWFAATAFAHALSMIECLWMWLPLLFIAFAAGARRLTIPLLIAFAVCEGGAIGLLQLEHRLDEYVYSEAVPPLAPP